MKSELFRLTVMLNLPDDLTAETRAAVEKDLIGQWRTEVQDAGMEPVGDPTIRPVVLVPDWEGGDPEDEAPGFAIEGMVEHQQEP